MKLGICFGGYCPLHRGHLDVIMRAKKECDRIVIVVCGYDNEPRADEIQMPLSVRYLAIKKNLQDEITDVILINDTELGLDESESLSNWKIWTSAVMDKIHKLCLNFNKDDVYFYVSEASYFDALHNHLGYNCICLKREICISGTDIRNNPYKYWNYISNMFKYKFTKKILVIGTASEGKTMLCKDISTFFNIPWIPEYGRLYMEQTGLRDDKLKLDHFIEFVDKQNDSMYDFLKNYSPAIIIDSDNVTTLMYAYAYAERDEMAFTSEEYKKLKEYVDKFPPFKFDMIYILCPSEGFVEDGIRYMGQASMDEREKNFKRMMDFVDEYYPKVPRMVLPGSDFKGNFKIVSDYLKNLGI